MTREEAVSILKTFKITGDRNHEAFDMAIKALEQEPCDDCISRQAVDELSKSLVHTTKNKADFLCNFWEGLQKLPSVSPQQKVGRWIQKEEEGDAEPFIIWECSECHCVDEDGKPSYKYCPQCGAKMEGKENG